MGTKMSTKGIDSSLMPNVAPPSENMVTNTGIIMLRTKAECVCARATLLIIESMASVRCRTEKAPPTMSTKPMISAASMKPLMGAIISSTKPCGLLAM